MIIYVPELLKAKRSTNRLSARIEALAKQLLEHINSGFHGVATHPQLQGRRDNRPIRVEEYAQGFPCFLPAATVLGEGIEI